MLRRTFVKEIAVLASVAPRSPTIRLLPLPRIHPSDDITAAHIPRWRGFNLQGRFPWPGHPYDGARIR